MVTRFPPGKLEPPPKILPSVITLNNLKRDMNSPRTIVESCEVGVVTSVSAQRNKEICDSPDKVIKKVAYLQEVTKDPPPLG